MSARASDRRAASHCTAHGPVVEPGKGCLLCHADRALLDRAAQSRRLRRAARCLLATVAGVTAFVWLLAAFDTMSPPPLAAQAASPPRPLERPLRPLRPGSRTLDPELVPLDGTRADPFGYAGSKRARW